ncbi:hypothetical protein ABT025_39170 [Streptomyces sp. NPDC002809]|uniref:hypothetical protein n=1 Tax=Streptomyces sp. NPDC002809 TaxID=3154433 RepID=UPI0033186C0D
MSYSGGDPDDYDYGDGGDGLRDGGTRINARADGRSRITVAGRDITSTYFVSASSAALAALVGLVLLLGMWHPWQEAASVGEGKPSNGSTLSATPTSYREPPSGGETYREPQGQETSASPTPSDSPTPTPTPTPTPDPPDPVDVAFASAQVGTCLNVFDDGWGRLNHDRPTAVDCGANFAFSKVTMVATSTAGCPQGGGQQGWGHVNDDGSSIALCLDRVFVVGQCFPATLTKQADGSLRGTGRLFSVWGCDQTKVPRGQNAIMAITAVVSGGGCPQRSDRQTLSWQIFNGARKVCAVQMKS